MIRLSLCAVPDCVWLDADNCRGMLTLGELRQLLSPQMAKDINALVEKLTWTEDNTPAERMPDTIPCAPEGKA